MLEKIFPDKHEGFEDIGEPSVFKGIILTVFQLFLIGVAGYLAWDCNKGQTPLMRVVFTVLAVVFSGIYILFYVIYHNILNVECK